MTKYKDEEFGFQNKSFMTSNKGDNYTRCSTSLFAILLYVVVSLQRKPLQWTSPLGIQTLM